MDGFSGTYKHTLDHKGRLIFPARFRQLIIEISEGQMVLLKGLERCVYVYPQSIWAKFNKNLDEQEIDYESRLILQRHFNFYNFEAIFDKQGRLNLPVTLIEYARLEKDVLVGGASDHIEIWNESVLEEHLESSRDVFHRVLGNIQSNLLK